MLSNKRIEEISSQIEELSEKIQRLSENQNSQFTDIMLALKDLKKEQEGLSLNGAREGMPSQELYEKAKEIVIKTQTASASLLQRRLKIGYVYAVQLMDKLEENGVIAEADGISTPRKVLIAKEED